jgi:hypothetical protein
MNTDNEFLIIEWYIPAWLQAEMDWWEQHPNATYAEFHAAGF